MGPARAAPGIPRAQGRRVRSSDTYAASPDTARACGSAHFEQATGPAIDQDPDGVGRGSYVRPEPPDALINAPSSTTARRRAGLGETAEGIKGLDAAGKRSRSAAWDGATAQLAWRFRAAVDGPDNRGTSVGAPFVGRRRHPSASAPRLGDFRRHRHVVGDSETRAGIWIGNTQAYTEAQRTTGHPRTAGTRGPPSQTVAAAVGRPAAASSRRSGSRQLATRGAQPSGPGHLHAGSYAIDGRHRDPSAAARSTRRA